MQVPAQLLAIPLVEKIMLLIVVLILAGLANCFLLFLWVRIRACCVVLRPGFAVAVDIPPSQDANCSWNDFTASLALIFTPLWGASLLTFSTGVMNLLATSVKAAFALSFSVSPF